MMPKKLIIANMRIDKSLREGDLIVADRGCRGMLKGSWGIALWLEILLNAKLIRVL